MQTRILVDSAGTELGRVREINFANHAIASIDTSGRANISVVPKTIYGGGRVTFSNTSSQFISILWNESLATESIVQSPVPVAGTFKRLYINLTTNTYTVAINFILRVNGANSALGSNIPAGTTGIFVDTTNSVNVLDSDLVCYQFSSTVATGSIRVAGSVEFDFA